METHVISKGQIVIPVQLRRKYGIKGGTRIVILDEGNAIILKPMTEKYLKRLQGSLKGGGGLNTRVDDRCIEVK